MGTLLAFDLRTPVEAVQLGAPAPVRGGSRLNRAAAGRPEPQPGVLGEPPSSEVPGVGFHHPPAVRAVS